MDGVPAVAQAGEAQRENLHAVGIVLGDEAVVLTHLDTPSPSYGEAVAEQLQGTTGVGEVVAMRIEHVAAAEDFTGLGIDLQTEQAGVLRGVAVAVVEEGQRAVVVQRGIVLAVEAQRLVLLVAGNAPDDVARTVLTVDLQQ